MERKAANGLGRRPWQARVPVYYGWVIVGVLFQANFVNAIIALWGLSVLAGPMADDLGWSRSSLFLPLTIRAVIAAIGTPLVGHFLDRKFGSPIMMATSGMLTAGTVILASTADHEWQWLLYFGIFGGFASLGQSFVITSAIVPKWFIRQRGRALAFATTAGGAAAFVIPLPLTALVNATDWRMTWVVIALASFAFTVPFAYLVRRQPEDVGLLPDGALAASATTAPTGALSETRSLTMGQAVRTRTFWFIALGLTAASLSVVGLPASMISWYMDSGYSGQAAAAAFTVYGLMSMLARFGWGFLAERSHPRVALIALALYAVPVMLLLPMVIGYYPLLILVSAMTGYAVGGIVVLNPIMWPTYFGRAHLGAITGVVVPLTTVGAAAGPLMMSSIFDLTGSYTLGMIILAVAWATCAAFIFAVQPVQREASEAG